VKGTRQGFFTGLCKFFSRRPNARVAFPTISGLSILQADAVSHCNMLYGVHKWAFRFAAHRANFKSDALQQISLCDCRMKAAFQRCRSLRKAAENLAFHGKLLATILDDNLETGLAFCYKLLQGRGRPKGFHDPVKSITRKRGRSTLRRKVALAGEGCMQVADDNIIRMARSVDFTGGAAFRSVATPLETVDETTAHDPRGLIVSLLLCLGCWVALAYFLLG